MALKWSVRGIAFVVLMFGFVSIAVAINLSSPNPSSSSVSDTVGASRTFSITADENANFTWYINESVVQELNENSTTSSYSNTSAALGYWNVTVYAVAVNGSGSQSNTWWWTVTSSSSPPSITSSNPSSPFTSYAGTSVEFNITVNQVATINWTIDGVLYPDNTTVGTSSSYINSTAAVGTYTVKANATNSNGSVERTWNWTVTNAPDTTPPASVTGLTLAGNGTTWLNVSWTNPGDADFHHVMVYRNSTFVGNTTSNTTNFYNITGLNAGTTSEITVKTVDTNNNVNQTGASLTANTDPNTPASGSPVTVVVSSNSTVTFATVTTAGNTVEYPNSSQSLPSSSYTAVGSYIDISTTAAYTAPVTVRVKYTQSLLPSGYVESDVRLYHWNDSTGKWDNVTTSVDSGSDEVIGSVSTLSPFVPGVAAKPAIIKVSPLGANIETIGSASQTFRITVNQNANVTWAIGGSQVNNSGLVSAGVQAEYTHTPSSTGNFNFSVTATNANGTDTEYWNWTVRPKSYETGNRVWDASKEMNLTYTWNPMSFYAFYYDLDNNVGNESLRISLDSRSDRDIQENTLRYFTAPDNVSFEYKPWGSYNVIGFMAEKYFAAYTTGSTGITGTPISLIASKQLHRILMDDDTRRAVYAGSTLTLSEGYVLKIKDVDITGGKIVLISLLKDGSEVDTTAVQAGNTYMYSKRVGAVSNVPIIAVHIDTVFAGREANAAFLKGIFQISESYTSVSTGNRYGIMEIKSASDTGITMLNDNSFSLSPGTIVDVMGDIKFIVADNSSMLRFAPLVRKSGTYEVRGTISQNTDTSFVWNPLNFEGFYYDINEDVGSENLSLTRTDRTITEKALVYTSTPQSVSFKYKNFGSYKVIGFMADKYFAGYIGNSTGLSQSDVSTINSKQLHKVLADDDTRRAVYAGSTLTLSEGYVLKVKDVDITGNKVVLVSLLKDGTEIDLQPVFAGNDYKFTKRVGSVSELLIIGVHIETVFAGREANAAFIRGIFQISESYTSVKQGDDYGIMEVTAVSDTKIEMKNPSSVSLSAAGTVDVMGNIKFKVADSSDIRFYPFILVNGSAAAANQLSINVPSSPSVRDTIIITVTAGAGAPIEGASVSFDNVDIGTTNSTGKMNYTLTRSGKHNITATKLGYEKATKTIDVSEWVDNRLSIEVPSVIDQGFPVSIKVVSNGTGIAGASVTFDNSPIGSTDIKGVLNYTFNVSGTHNLGASKEKYISVVREISIRMPFSEYKALDIAILPSVVFTNEEVLIRSNITNVGTKADTKPVELILNGTVVDNVSVALAPGEIKEVNFTRMEALPGNYTVEILGQKGLLEVKEEPLNLLLIGGIATGFGAIIIYLLTAKTKLSLGLLKQKLSSLLKAGKKEG